MVTWFLVAVNVVVFAIEVSMGPELDAFVRRWCLVPADVHTNPAALVTLFTSMFLHVGWLHLGSNIIYLSFFGPRVERALGPLRFVAIYTASGLLGSLAYVMAQPTSQSPAIGASGAIAGLIAAHLVLFLHVVESTPTLVLLLLLWLATQVFSSVASLTTSTAIAWWAHLGGFGTGLVLAPVLRRRRMAR